MKTTKQRGIDSPDIMKYFSNPAPYDEWIEKLGQPLTKTIVNIPARSNSKRLKDKNIKILNGIPLLAYSVLIARSMPIVDRIFINSDSPEYAAIGKEFGAEAPFLRPKELSGDSASIGLSNHFLYRYLMEENYPACSIINLYPTSPFRNIDEMNKLASLLTHHSIVVSAMQVDFSVSKIRSPDGSKIINKAAEEMLSTAKLFYKTTGAFLGLNRTSTHNSRKIYFHKNIIEAIDIDSEKDFLLAEKILQDNLYDFGIKICR